MTVPAIQTSFVTGEVSPALFGHPDLARMHSAVATCRNMYVGYKGGAYSRAGTAFVGISNQTGRAWPPRLIPFQFKIDQGLVLEFGNLYMRVISNGAYVTETPISITGITQSSPAVVSASSIGASTAVPITSGVISSYATADTVTLAGGTFTAPTVLTVNNTALVSVALNAAGSGYAATDTITLAGGTFSTAASVVVSTTSVTSATINAAGTGGINGTQTVTGTTGTGTKFQASVTVTGGAITAVLSITVAGVYTVNPTAIAAEPVTGAGLVGAKLAVVLIINTITLLSGGTYTVNSGPTLTQSATSGSGTGATFQAPIFGPKTVTITSPGNYTTYPANPVGQAATSGGGLGATFTITTTGVASYQNGDWVFLSGIVGMAQLNGGTYVIGGATPGSFQLFDVYGNAISSLSYNAYVSGGTSARIYNLITPYLEVDLAYLKYVQSADVMSLTCVNQKTLGEYQPMELVRTASANWTINALATQPTVLPPSGIPTGTPTAAGTATYNYAITALDPNPKHPSESVASATCVVANAVSISTTAGTISLAWNAVPGVNQYNIYKALPAYSGAAVPVGALFGYVGSAYGTQFIDSNLVADFSQTPPLHRNPFARGQIISANPITGGSGYGSLATAVITTATGSGAVLQPVIQSGALVAIIIVDSGKNYLPSDTVTITGTGTSATASLQVSSLNGTYPSVVSYFQQRRVYANTLNNPDTYFMSKPGSYTNFDTRVPSIANDSITGTPWSRQVNGIQFLIEMPGGLVALTGVGGWQLTGAGGSGLNPQPITPSTQQAQPQGSNGCSATVPPIRIESEIVFVHSKGSTYRAFAYQIFANNYIPTDLTQNSSHLFSGFQILEHAWAEEPYKVLWSVRNDGIILSMTYNKQQEVLGWARHDTQGFYKSICTVTEPPVDAIYVATQRFPTGGPTYMIERMDNRIWNGIEDTWCVDAGLALPQPKPLATLNASSAAGLGSISGIAGLIGGTGYSASTTASIIDNNGAGPGTGAILTVTITGGVITTLPVSVAGSAYINPQIVILDPQGTGSGASATATLNNTMTFTASAAVFSVPSIGSFIRMGGGIAKITAFIDTTHVTATIMSPILALIPNYNNLPQPQPPGMWTMTAPVTVLSGLVHLAGMLVTGIADGNVIPPTIVSAQGTVTLATPVSSATAGLAFQVQLQSVYLDAGEPSIQGQRKKIAAVTTRIEASRGIKAGSNQPDGSVLSPPQLAPAWGLANIMEPVPDNGVMPYNGLAQPLFTGDVRIPVLGGWDTKGQVAVQQDNPLPMNILSFIPDGWSGDDPEIKASPRQQQRGKQ